MVHCRAWISQLQGLLHTTGQRELTALHKHMTAMTEATQAPVTSMRTLADAIALQQRLEAEAGTFAARLGPVEVTYATLTQFEV